MPTTDQLTKFCTRCDRTKPTRDFSRSTRDGLAAWCKPCTNEYRREWRKRNPPSSRGTGVGTVAHRQGYELGRLRAFYNAVDDLLDAHLDGSPVPIVDIARLLSEHRTAETVPDA